MSMDTWLFTDIILISINTYNNESFLNVTTVFLELLNTGFRNKLNKNVSSSGKNEAFHRLLYTAKNSWAIFTGCVE